MTKYNIDGQLVRVPTLQVPPPANVKTTSTVPPASALAILPYARYTKDEDLRFKETIRNP